MSRRRCVLFVVLWAIDAAATTAAEPSLTAQQQARLKDRDRNAAQCDQLIAAGKLAEAADAIQKALAIEHDVLGGESWDVVASLDRLAEIQAMQGELAASRKTCEQALAIAKRRTDSPWRLTDARLAVEQVGLAEKLTPDQRRQLAEAFVLGYQIDVLVGQRRYRQAIPVAKRVHDLRKPVLPASHPLTARINHALGFLYNSIGEFASAEPYARKGVEIGRQVYGDHPDYATSLSNLAFALAGQGKLSEAITFYRQTGEVRQRTLGPADPMTRSGWNSVASELGKLADRQARDGDLAAARESRAEALRTRIKVDGRENWRTADAQRALDDVARLEKLDAGQRQQLFEADNLKLQVEELLKSGKYQEALAPALRALEIRRTLLGEKHAAYCSSLHTLGMTYEALGEYSKALATNEQAVRIEKELLGVKHPDYAASLNNLAGMYSTLGDFARAEPAYREAVEVTRGAVGDQHMSYATALGNVALFYQHLGNFAKAEPLYEQSIALKKKIVGDEHPDYALSIGNLAGLYYDMGNYARAEPLYLKVCEIYKATLGERHPDYLQSLNNLAKFYEAMGNDAKAEPLLLQTLQARKAILGERHPAYAESLSNLAGCYRLTGQHAKARPLLEQALRIWKTTSGETSADYANVLIGLAMLDEKEGKLAQSESLWRQALEIYRRVSGEKHSDYLLALDGLASLCRQMGDYAQAEPLAQRSVQTYREVFGEKHPDYATSLNNLGKLYVQMRDYIRAEPVLLEAMQIRKEAFGDKSVRYASTVGELGILYKELRHYEKAEQFYRQALAVDEKAVGRMSTEYAQGLNNIAVLYTDMGKPADAERLLREAVDIKKAIYGPQHPEYALSLENLAAAYVAQADYAKALPLNRQTLQITQAALGDQHPSTILSLYNLGVVYFGLREYGEAERLLRDAVRRAREQLELTAAVQSQRQQLQMSQRLRSYLDQYLSLVDEAKLPVDAAYGEVLAWKGAVSSRQQAIRRSRQKLAGGNSPEVAKLFDDLNRATEQLSELSQATPAPTERKAHPRRLVELSDAIEQLERSLAGASRQFRDELDERQRTPAELQKTLPADAVLIDLLECDHYVPPAVGGKRPKVERRLRAFVVRPEGPIVQLDIGPAQKIGSLVDLWRANFGLTRPGQKIDAAAELRRVVWARLEPHLRGAKLVLLSPDGPTARFPWPALAGSKPGTYLIDDLSIAIVPVPRKLPELVTEQAARARSPGTPSLLLVGDVDFGADSGELALAGGDCGAARGGEPLHWSPLPGTRAEVAAIAAGFRRQFHDASLVEFTLARATKSAIRNAAGGCEYLHFSTHGFFAPPQLRSALSVSSRPDRLAADVKLETRQDLLWFHPGLLSGLVLTGANRPPAKGRDDGILTALEVAELDLSGVQLATLSACETGLGETAGGEGLLGLQRAFQTAGAQTVVASLWKVPDKSTEVLMGRFYDNLWTRKLGRLDALVEAQRWLLNQGATQAELVRARGLQTADDGEYEPLTPGRLPPRYWAAFVLSGDWR